jgi:hypothetical protein
MLKAIRGKSKKRFKETSKKMEDDRQGMEKHKQVQHPDSLSTVIDMQARIKPSKVGQKRPCLMDFFNKMRIKHL